MWTLSTAWNKGFDLWAIEDATREPKPRDYLWASELGNSDIDIYLKLIGQPTSNKPDVRSHRKFEAGDQTENVVATVLKRMGILKTRQKYVEYQYPKLLRVTGKVDFIAGGKIDIDKAVKTLENDYDFLSDRMKFIFIQAVNELSKQYPNGLEELPLEIKSCSLNMFDIYAKIGAGSNHQMQLFHYLKSEDWREGHIIYLCRDDYRLAQYAVFNPSNVENDYKSKIDRLTRYYNSKELPPKEETIMWNSALAKFTANWNVMYSSYLTYLYGYEHQEDYRTKIEPLVRQMNSALDRYVQGKKQTDLNKSSIDEINKRGFDLEVLIADKKKSKVEVAETQESIDSL